MNISLKDSPFILDACPCLLCKMNSEIEEVHPTMITLSTKLITIFLTNS